MTLPEIVEVFRLEEEPATALLREAASAPGGLERLLETADAAVDGAPEEAARVAARTAAAAALAGEHRAGANAHHIH